MDEYLLSIGVEISATEILRFALKNLDVRKVNYAYIVHVSNTEMAYGYTLRELVDIIDYGTTEVKGTRAYLEAEEYINSHRTTLLNDYANYLHIDEGDFDVS